MFKNKVNIVEAHYPPSNKNDWWFDLNENILKRYFGREWKQYDTPPPIYINMPADNEIWLYIDGDASEVDIINAIRSYTSETPVSCTLQDNVAKVTFENNIRELKNSWMPEIFDLAYIRYVKLPKLSFMGNEMEEQVFNMDFASIIIQDTDKILYNAVSSWTTIICVADTPPEIEYNSFGEPDGENYQPRIVYVKDDLVTTYRNSTNWSDLDIRPLSEVDKSIYNWG